MEEYACGKTEASVSAVPSYMAAADELTAQANRYRVLCNSFIGLLVCSSDEPQEDCVSTKELKVTLINNIDRNIRIIAETNQRLERLMQAVAENIGEFRLIER